MAHCNAQPLTNAEAAEFLSRLHTDPAVSHLEEPPVVKALWLKLAGVPQAAPNLWMDAYLAAVAIAVGAQLVTFDRGFRMFEPRGLNLQLLPLP